MLKYYFKEGEEVFHKDNLEKKLIISRILKESVAFKKGFDEKTGTAIIEKSIRMIGIECHWWELSEALGEKSLRKHKFHSTELIPYEVGIKGKEAIIKWLREYSN
jgi:uncharacterized protein YodC (DUF2158 family)